MDENKPLLKIKIGVPEDGQPKEAGEFNHDDHMQVMESGIKQAIEMIKGGDSESAISELTNLLGEEKKEAQEMPAEEPTEEKPSFRDDMKKAIGY